MVILCALFAFILVYNWLSRSVRVTSPRSNYIAVLVAHGCATTSLTKSAEKAATTIIRIVHLVDVVIVPLR